jgi:glycosyltransferase involved in cell wall biosynthesis
MKDNKTQDKIKVLFASDSPLAETGLAQVSKNILKALHKTGKYELHVIPCNNHQYAWYDQEKYPYVIYNNRMDQDPYQMDTLKNFIKTGGYDILFTCYDQQIVAPLIPLIEEAKTKFRFKWIHYSPVDAYGCTEGFFKPWVDCDYPVSYTNFGYNEAIKVFPKLAKKLEVIYHGSDLNLKRLDDEEREEFRTKYFQKHKDKFIVSFVNRNQWRKDPATLLRAFKEFNKKHPASVLYMHCDIDDTVYGTHLVALAIQVGLKPGENIIFREKEVSRSLLAKILSSVDCMVSTAYGGGWELTTTECFATKTPVIVPDNTCFTEIIGENEERGYLADSGKNGEWDIIYTKSSQLRPRTHIPSLLEKLEKVYNDFLKDGVTDTTKKTKAAREWAEQYDWTTQANKFVDLFNRAYNDLEDASHKISTYEYEKKLPELYGKEYYTEGKNGGYQGYTEENVGKFTNKFVHAALSYFPQDKIKKVLDGGCATGLMVKEFRRLGYDAKGFDISEWGIANCVDEAKGHVEVADVRDLSRYEDNSFDLVVISETLEHIPEEYLEDIFKQLNRVTKQFLLFSVPLGYNKVDEHETHYTIHRREWWNEKFKNYFKYYTTKNLHNYIWNIFPLEKK